MAYIYRSKEVYKRIPNVDSGQNPLRAVRGVYVSGAYRAPYYIDHQLSITDISSSVATLSAYSKTFKSIKDNSLNVINITSTDFTIIDYSTMNDQLTDNSLNVLNITTGDFDITCYSSESVTSEDDSLNIINVSTEDFDITFYNNLQFNNTEDFLISIQNIISTQATITNVV